MAGVGDKIKNFIATTGAKLKTADGFNDLTVQVAKLWNIEGDYSSPKPFAIKNNTGDNVTLNVRLYAMDEFIETVFYPGWNVELVCEVKGAPAGIQGGSL